MLWWLYCGLRVASAWELDARVWHLDEHVWLDTASGTLSFDEAWVFRVIDEGEHRGVVVVGGGAQMLHFPGALQAEVAANRLAVTEAPPAQVAAVLEGQGWQGHANAAVILGSGVEVPADAIAVRERPRAVTWRGEDGTLEVLVTALARPRTARRRAVRLLAARLAAWARAGRFPGDRVVVDQLEERQGMRFVAAVEVDDLGWTGDRWLSWEHDPSGTFGGGNDDAIHAGACCRRLSATTTGTRGAQLAGVGVIAAVQIAPGGQAVRLASAANLRVDAVGDDQRVVILAVPRVVQEGWHGAPPLPEGWALEAIEDGQGRRLRTAPLRWTEHDHWRRVAVELAEPLAAGEQVLLKVRWRDHQRYAHVLTLSSGEGEVASARTVLLNVSNTPIPMTPLMVGDTSPAPVAYRVAVTSEVRHDQAVALAGARADDPREGITWLEGQTTVGQAGLAVGRYRHRARLTGPEGLPDVAVWLQQRGSAGDILGRTARLVEAATPHTEAWPATVHVVDGRTAVKTDPYDTVIPTAHGTGGLVWLSQLFVALSYNQQGLTAPRDHHLAGSLAWSRWTSLGPLRGEASDVAWFAALLAAGWAALGDDPDHATRWRDHIRTSAMAGGGPLVDDGEALHRHRQYLAVDGLLDAFGDEAVYEALAGIQAGDHPPSWVGLADALEATSGIEARGWVALWLASGVRPSLDVRWRYEAATSELVARLVTDVPVGAFPIDVVARDGHRQERARVTVRNGAGTLRMPWSGPVPRKIEVEAGDLPLRRVEVREAPAGPPTR